MHIVFWILASVALLVLAGTVYQHLGSLRDRRIHTSQGRWVSIGRRCQLYFFEAGQRRTDRSLRIRDRRHASQLARHSGPIATLAHTIAYDRAGLGWSSPCRTPRTPGNIATELHRDARKRRASSRRTFWWDTPSAGWSCAALRCSIPMKSRAWSSSIPCAARNGRLSTPAGNRNSILAIASSVTRCQWCAAGWRACWSHGSSAAPGNLSDQIAGAAGAHPRHVLGRIKTEVRKMPRKVWPAVAAHWSRPSFYAGLRSHIRSIPATVREMHTAEPICGIPVTVLTPGNAAPLTQNQLDHIGDSVHQTIAREERALDSSR